VLICSIQLDFVSTTSTITQKQTESNDRFNQPHMYLERYVQVYTIEPKMYFS